MKLEMRLKGASGASEHQLDLRPGANDGRGQAQFLLDAGELQSADWSEVEPGVYSILLNGKSYEARATRSARSVPGVMRYEVAVGERRFLVEVHDPRKWRTSSADAGRGPQEIVAPMPGRIVKVLVKEGHEIKSGEGLVVVEAMKMQNEIRAPRAGRVESVYVMEGEGVETGSRLLRLE
ncbi:MAG TPA: biotin/lipoyl-containing protein [Terriglobia bacterium]|nr:biotin/lipoyl-containing protein [Terriglobia bacterium]